MIKLRVDDETAIPLSVDSSSAVSMTVSEAFIDRGGSAIQNNKNATPSTSQVVVTPDQGYDAMAKVTVAAMPQGEVDPASLSYDTYLLRGRITAEANVTQAGYVPIGGNVARAYCDELLPSENPKTVTPTTSEQVAVAANKWTKGQIKVGPIPSEYIIPSGTKSISANGTGIDVKAYEKVDVAVPGITPSGTLAIATNGSHDVTNYATASVAVPASAVDSGTKSITANGNGQDVVGYAAVNVNVPNSYAAADEGKVVQSGALVSQSSATYTENGTYDTTTKNEVVVDVQSGGGGGMVEIASGTLTGAGQAVNIDIPLGKKMPQRNFAFRLLIDPSCTITSDGNYYVMAVNDYIAYPNYINMSAAGTNTMKTELYINNGSRMVIAGTRYVVTARNINSFTYSDVGNTGYWRYKRDNTTGFSISIQNFNGSFIFKSGEKYNWSLIYFGNDPTNDIVEIP